MFLITGANGQLGTALHALLQDKAEYIDREDLDLTNEEAVKTFFSNKHYDFVINCAAYTAVDKAEEDLNTAYKINALAPKYLGKYAKNVIHISTDYVFDGMAYTPYTEDMTPTPLSVYGQTKREGEINVLEQADTAIVIRTSWLYSPHGTNFVKTIRKLASERESLNVIFDQIGTPTNAYDLAQAIITIIPQIAPKEKGIYHFSNEGVCSWYDFATEIVLQSNLTCQINPIESKDYKTLAKRPFYSVLNKGKIKQRFNITIPHWKEGLKQCLKLF